MEEKLSDTIYNPAYEQSKEPELSLDLEKFEECLKGVFEKVENEGVTLTQDVKDFLKHYVEKYDGGAVINDPENNQIVSSGIFTNSEGELEIPETTLYIENPETFVKLLQELHDTIYLDEHNEAILPWLKGQTIQNVWLNATPGDYYHPDVFLGRTINVLRDETFCNFTEWTKVSDVPVGGNTEHLFIRHDSIAFIYESPHDLRISITPENKPTEIDDLPVIRYGIIEPGVAEIYAIQMPRIGDKTEKVYREELEKSQNYCKATQEYLAELFQKHPVEAQTLIGGLPEEFLQPFEPEKYAEYGNKLAAYLSTLAEAADMDDYIEWADKQVDLIEDPSIRITFLNTLKDLEIAVETIEKLDGVQKEFEIYDARRERLSRFTPDMKEGMPKEFRGAPPTSVISLTAGLGLLHESGVNEVIIPAFLPKRKHAEDELDERILSQMMQTVGRVTNDVQGVELSQDPEEDGYFHLKLKGELKSSHPLLGAVLEGAKNFDVEQ